MKHYNLSQIMKDAHKLYKNEFQRRGRTFGECLAAAWSWEKDAVKARAEKEAKIQEVITQSWAKHEVNKGNDNPYNDLSIPSSAFYSGSKGYMGASFCND